MGDWKWINDLIQRKWEPSPVMLCSDDICASCNNLASANSNVGPRVGKKKQAEWKCKKSLKIISWKCIERRWTNNLIWRKLWPVTMACSACSQLGSHRLTKKAFHGHSSHSPTLLGWEHIHCFSNKVKIMFKIILLQLYWTVHHKTPLWWKQSLPALCDWKITQGLNFFGFWEKAH